MYVDGTSISLAMILHRATGDMFGVCSLLIDRAKEARGRQAGVGDFSSSPYPRLSYAEASM